MTILILIIAVLLSPAVWAGACEEALLVRDVAWLPLPNQAQWIPSDKLPAESHGLVTGAYVLGQYEGKFLMGRHHTRGWDIVGGHVDSGEKPEDAAKRECREETGATVGQLRLVAYQKIEIFGPKPEGYLYPYPVSYQALYTGKILQLGEFLLGDEDTVERQLFTLEEAMETVPWVQRSLPLVHRAEVLLGKK